MDRLPNNLDKHQYQKSSHHSRSLHHHHSKLLPLVQISSLEGQGIQEVGRQGGREGPRAAGSPGAHDSAVRRRVARVGVRVLLLLLLGMLLLVLEHQEVLHLLGLDLRGRTGWAPGRTTLGFNAALQGARGVARVVAAVYRVRDAVGRGGLLLRQALLLTEFSATVLEPYLQQK